MMDSDEDLKRFQAILKIHREKILAMQEPTYMMTELDDELENMDANLLLETSMKKPDA